MARHGKKYLAALEKVDQDRLYTPQEAIELLKSIAFANFDETVEVHCRLNIDPRHSEQQVRSTVLLPHGLGKEVRILAFVEGEAVQIAKDAGVDIIGDDEIIAKIEKEGWVDFDAAIAIPSMMRKIGRLGKVLGRRGLMPSPKSGTVVQPEDLAQAVQEARAGRVAYRNDKTGNVHVPIGRVSFDAKKLEENMAAFMESLRVSRPSAVKGAFVKRCVVTSTMAPGIQVDPNLALNMAVVAE
ncbi:MAG: 50S ribosomal protein L1 [Phototrophicales bacterium]|nr:MAG: 50S ribosomal protein L1 [Phototrophicales bacterium]